MRRGLQFVMVFALAVPLIVTAQNRSCDSARFHLLHWRQFVRPASGQCFFRAHKVFRFVLLRQPGSARPIPQLLFAQSDWKTAT